MLVANKSKVIVEIDLNLVFDDDTIKSFIVQEGDILAIVFRQNFKNLQKVGRIVKIEYVAPPKNSGVEPSALITFDCSGKHSANIQKILLDDILNVEQVDISEDEPEIDFEDLELKIFGGV